MKLDTNLGTVILVCGSSCINGTKEFDGSLETLRPWKMEIKMNLVTWSIYIK